MEILQRVPQGGIYPHIKFERDPLNILLIRALTLSGSKGGDAKTIISPNTLFGDIRTRYYFLEIKRVILSNVRTDPNLT